jgi:hypothetical protein
VKGEQDLQRTFEVAELVLEEVRRGHAGRHAILGGSALEQREARQRRRRLLELAAPDGDLARERERSDVIGLQHCDVLESLERGLLLAFLAHHASLLPEKLGDLGGIVACREAPADDLEQQVALFPLSDAPE